MSVGKGITIRRATPADAPVIAELFTATRTQCLPFLPKLHTAEEDSRFIADVVMSRGQVWVAEEGSRVVGLLALHGEMVDHLYVAISCQRRGIGSSLLDQAKASLPGGFSLWVFQQNTAARRFYESRGMVLVCETDGRSNEERTPDALYAWRKDVNVLNAAQLLRAGGLVAFPTETVYGLGADATSDDAVRKIFAAKGRPATNPLIVHVADVDVARRYTTRWPDAAQALAAKFWPGPLTLVLPKSPEISKLATAGLETVGLRSPDHPVALELLRAFDGPVAAPSANRSTRVSPTTAQHVRDELGDAVQMVLDGGPCRVGIESTVLDLSGETPRILRPGSVTREQIEAVVGSIESEHRVTDATVPASAPGQHAIHYAPATPAYRFETSQRQLIHPETPDGRINGILAIGSGRESVRKWGSIVAMPRDASLYARHLYEILRELDAMGLAAIYVEMPPETVEWTAVRDRLLRATSPLPSA